MSLRRVPARHGVGRRAAECRIGFSTRPHGYRPYHATNSRAAIANRGKIAPPQKFAIRRERIHGHGGATIDKADIGFRRTAHSDQRRPAIGAERFRLRITMLHTPKAAPAAPESPPAPATNGAGVHTRRCHACSPWRQRRQENFLRPHEFSPRGVKHGLHTFSGMRHRAGMPDSRCTLRPFQA